MSSEWISHTSSCAEPASAVNLYRSCAAARARRIAPLHRHADGRPPDGAYRTALPSRKVATRGGCVWNRPPRPSALAVGALRDVKKKEPALEQALIAEHCPRTGARGHYFFFEGRWAESGTHRGRRPGDRSRYGLGTEKEGP